LKARPLAGFRVSGDRLKAPLQVIRRRAHNRHSISNLPQKLADSQ